MVKTNFRNNILINIVFLSFNIMLPSRTERQSQINLHINIIVVIVILHHTESSYINLYLLLFWYYIKMVFQSPTVHYVAHLDFTRSHNHYLSILFLFIFFYKIKFTYNFNEASIQRMAHRLRLSNHDKFKRVMVKSNKRNIYKDRWITW